jgi:hypothetical protein
VAAHERTARDSCHLLDRGLRRARFEEVVF